MEVGNALIDLGASVNIIPLSIVHKIGDLKIDPIVTTLHMMGKTCKKLVGTIKDVFIKIDKVSFHVDFMVLEIEVDQKISLILGRPFMKTAIMLVKIDNN